MISVLAWWGSDGCSHPPDPFVLMGEVVDAGLEPHLISRVLSCPERKGVVTRVFVSLLFPKPLLVLLEYWAWDLSSF